MPLGPEVAQYSRSFFIVSGIMKLLQLKILLFDLDASISRQSLREHV